jgi:DNA end-binding protein Ku
LHWFLHFVFFSQLDQEQEPVLAFLGICLRISAPAGSSERQLQAVARFLFRVTPVELTWNPATLGSPLGDISMAMRSSWEGFLQLSLISVPVRAYNAAIAGRGEIHFHQIHKNCGNRIRYQKVCPIHGEVSKEEIVSGYEYKKGEHVQLDPDEIATARAKKDEAITINAFIPPDRLDPIYLSGKTFYLVPDGPAGQKPYLLLHETMQQKDRYALAGMVLSGHEEMVLIRPAGKVLAMTVLYYDHQIKKASDFADEVGESKISAQERKLAGSLVDSSTTEEMDFSQYKDHFTERVKQVLEAKLAGKDRRAPKAEKDRPVVNLMDALRQSLKKTGSGAKPKTPRRSPRSPHVRSHAKRKAG